MVFCLLKSYSSICAITDFSASALFFSFSTSSSVRGTGTLPFRPFGPIMLSVLPIQIAYYAGLRIGEACRNIGLRKGYFCRLVLKYRFQLYHFHILSLIFGSHFQSLKRRDIPCRSCKFFDIVSTKWKVNIKYCLSIFPTDCFSSSPSTA